MTKDERGTALIYSSDNLLEGWEFAGELKVPGYESFGGMWECPCIANIGGKDVLIFSPQYTTLPHRGNSTNHNIYLVGKMDYDTLTFMPETPYRYLDYGFDFYAAQMAANVNDKDKAIMISWIGLPDNHYPSSEDEWEGSMTLPRELTLKDNKLIQKPLSSIKQLREEEIKDNDLPKACEIELIFNDEDACINLFTKEDGSQGLKINYDSEKQILSVDKSFMDNRFNEKIFEQLDINMEEKLTNISIFIDSCSIEMFINDGAYTFTAHIYPSSDEHYYHTNIKNIKVYKLKDSVVDDFVI